MQTNNTIFGIYPVKEALSSGIILDKVFIQKGIDSDKIENLIKDFEKANIPVSIVPFEKLNRLTRGNHQGIVAVTSPVAFHSLEAIVEKALESDKAPLFIILDQITDVRNFGAILRTAE
ncbi:MAG TPA: RNA methyltransferase substrate-binding domain-containing protein, partial [Aequorivita sp.]|nr:RNA methyltransferase substrate-binding domain-containing protein [Aequorivita sp.]